MENSKVNNPIYIVVKLIRGYYSTLGRWATFALLILPYFLIGIAYLIRSSGIMEWFDENPDMIYYAIPVCLVIIISLKPFVNHCEYDADGRILHKGKKVYYPALFSFVAMIFILSLLDETSFSILYKSLIISHIFILLFNNRESIEYYVKGSKDFATEWLYGIVSIPFKVIELFIRDFRILIFLLPMIIMMWLEDVILVGNDSGLYFVGYDSDSNWIGQLLAFGFILFSLLAIIRCADFRKNVYKRAANGEFHDVEEDNNYTNTLTSDPRFFGFLLGVLCFLNSHSYGEKIVINDFVYTLKDKRNV